jgi:hypothetical protein
MPQTVALTVNKTTVEPSAQVPANVRQRTLFLTLACR